MYWQLFSWSSLILRHSPPNARDRREGKQDKKITWGFFKSLFLLDSGHLAVSMEAALESLPYPLCSIFGLIQQKVHLIRVGGSVFNLCAGESNSRSIVLSDNVCMLIVIKVNIEYIMSKQMILQYSLNLTNNLVDILLICLDKRSFFCKGLYLNNIFFWTILNSFPPCWHSLWTDPSPYWDNVI